MGNVKLLKYPKKSHRKKVVLPNRSFKLAEFFGIMMGDGGINNPWQANITLNATKDAKYSRYVVKLCSELFGIFPAIRKRKEKNALVISLASTSVVDFLVSEGLLRGNKLKNGLKIPNWILKNKLFSKACVRGLVDTDGFIFVHTHKVSGKIYKNIGLGFTSYSLELIFQVAGLFEEFGIMAHISKDGRDIRLYKVDVIAKYLKIFGTSNERLGSVYKKWRDARAV